MDKVMKKKKETKCRVTILLTEKEKEDLQDLAFYSDRSLSSQVRYLVKQELNKYLGYEY